MPSGIPQKLVAEAQAIAIVPNMVRGAFIIGVQHGRGVLVTRGSTRRLAAAADDPDHRRQHRLPGRRAIDGS